MRTTSYITNAIPYVNGDPHLGHALEFIQADAIARHRRARGGAVRYLSGTDDHAFKNVLAAEAAGVPVGAFVDARAARFAALREPLELSYDAFIRTSVDPRHRAGVERLWRACAAAGDLYQRDYEGRYCTGCEAFLGAGRARRRPLPRARRPARARRRAQLVLPPLALPRAARGGHRRRAPCGWSRRRAATRSWRCCGAASTTSASRGRPSVRAAGGSRCRATPRRRSTSGSTPWPTTSRSSATRTDGADFATWWQESDERIHVVGKGISRFHAIYWPAILLSAGLPLPTRVLVHGYLTVDGAKIGKSSGNGADPAAVVDAYGADALRWWALGAVPRGGDADVRADVLARTAERLADGLGNLVNRTIALTLRARDLPPAPSAAPLDDAGRALLAEAAALPGRIDHAFDAYDLRAAAAAHDALVDAANRHVAATAPWTLLRAARDGDAAAPARLQRELATLRATCEVLATELEPFLPRASRRLAEALRTLDPALGRALFRKPAVSEAA